MAATKKTAKKKTTARKKAATRKKATRKAPSKQRPTKKKATSKKTAKRSAKKATTSKKRTGGRKQAAAKVTGKKPTLDELLAVLEAKFGPPPTALKDDDPLQDHLLVLVLSQYTSVEKAQQVVKRFSEDFLDFNEIRVSPLVELEQILSDAVPKERLREAAWNFRMALQDVWDGSHGLDLEPIRSKAPELQRKFIKHLPNIPGGAAALIYQLAIGTKQVALGPLEEHCLTRFGLLPRSKTRANLRAAIERRVKAPDRYRFAWLTGHAAHYRETDETFDLDDPFCQLLVRAKAKELQIREQQKKKDEAARIAAEKKRLQEEEKQRRKEERERKKREREEEKKRKVEERKRAAEERRKEAARKKAEAAAKKKAAAAKKKAAAARKKVASAAKKKTSKRNTASRKTTSRKKPTTKKGSTKKPASKQRTAKKTRSPRRRK